MKHLDEVGETYWQHFLFAMRFGIVMIIAGILLMVHAIFPNLFKSVGSDVVEHMHGILNERNKKADE